MKVLSIQQPWAWLILNGYKWIENRTWNTHYRGPLLIHASKGPVKPADYAAALKICNHPDVGIELPERRDLPTGGIVGVVNLTRIVTELDAGVTSHPFWIGPLGWVMEDPLCLPFDRVSGKLGLWSLEYHRRCCGRPGRMSGPWEVCCVCSRVKGWGDT